MSAFENVPKLEQAGRMIKVLDRKLIYAPVFWDAARTNKQTNKGQDTQCSKPKRSQLQSGLSSRRDGYMCEAASLHHIQEDFDLASLLARS